MNNKHAIIKNHSALNQAGATAIMFAMFFIIVISLLTIGFATLARKDQRAALDKTLSSQAEYAAESGVNAVKDYIIKAPNLDNRTSCTDPLPLTFLEPDFNGAAQITCYNWKKGAPEVIINGLNFGSPEWIPFKAVSGSIASVKIEWTSAGDIISGCGTGNINSIGQNTFPSLRIVTAEENLVTSNVNYLCPSSGSSSIAADGSDDGSIAQASCTGSTCTATISNPKNGLLAVAQVQSGNVSNIKITGFDTLGNKLELDGIYEIDVTAKSQDIVKRVYSTIARGGGGTSWSPGQFVVGSNNTLCKNYKVDSFTNANPPFGTTACP